jgi:HAD superfamily hydrolase (TIGR01509 family)
MLKAVFFDMDDTLIDWSQRSVDWGEFERRHLERVFNYVAREVHPIQMPDVFYDAVHYFARQSWMEAEREMRAPNLGTVLTRALEWIGVPSSQINIDSVLEAYDWELVDGVVVYPDVPEVLPLLVNHGVKIGLVTNAYQPMWMRDRELEAVGLLNHFADCRLSAADVGYVKPHPAIFETALERMGVHPDEAVFVGDNLEADVAGAQSVGMRGVLRSRDGLIMNDLIHPDGVIITLHDLLPLFDTWYPGWRENDAS